LSRYLLTVSVVSVSFISVYTDRQQLRECTCITNIHANTFSNMTSGNQL